MNPEHLEAVTHKENILRSPISITTICSKKTRCPHGHEYTKENVYVRKSNGGRACKACLRVKGRVREKNYRKLRKLKRDGIKVKKIPTMFERDWLGDKSRVIDKIHPGCEWVADGEGVATKKIDGTSCMVRGDKLFKRREYRPGEEHAPDFELADYDQETGKSIGWLPVGDGPEDRWHREAFQAIGLDDGSPAFRDGTYELLGPKIQGNQEGFHIHALVPHSAEELMLDGYIPRDFNGLRQWLDGKDIEGIVFHHPDGRMAKIKLKDFGLKRIKSLTANVSSPKVEEGGSISGAWK